MKALSVRLKITLSFVLTFVLTIIMFGLTLEKNESETESRVNKSQYTALFKQIVNIVEYNEKVANLHLHASLNAVEGEIKSLKTEPGNDFLAGLSRKYNLSGIYIIDDEGYLTKSSIYDLLVKKGLLPGFNLFEVCEEERDLVGTKGVYHKSPMLWIREVQDPSKYYWTYAFELGYILEVTYAFGDLDRIFREIKNTFREIREISLITPAQKIMSSSLSREEQTRRNLTEKPVIEYGETTWQEGSQTVMLRSFGPLIENQCGIPSPYYYTLRLAFDSTPDRAGTQDLAGLISKYIFLFPVSVLTLLLFFYALRLANGIITLNSRMQGYMLTNESLKKPYAAATGDEIVQINHVFDQLMAHTNALMAKEKKLSRYSAIGQTTEYLAHDIREPFSKLKALLKLIKLTQQKLSSRVEQYIPVIENSADRVEAMLSDIMNFGSALQLTLDNYQLNEIIDSCFREHVGPGWNKDIKIVCDIRHTSLVRTDRHKIFRVLVNLLDNAVLATPPGGSITITTLEKGAWITVSCHNTGSYIPPEKIKTIFDPFVKCREKGTGLGLAIVRDIVSTHGGSIECRSQKESGTTFTFTVPAAKGEDRFKLNLPGSLKEFHSPGPLSRSEAEEQLFSQVKQKLAKSEKPLRIGILDDDEIYISALVNMLKPLDDYIALDALSGISEISQSDRFASARLLILDLDLRSDITGQDVLTYMRNKPGERYICIHTNQISPGYVRELSLQGADLVTPKPMSFSNLLNICLASLEL